MSRLLPVVVAAGTAALSGGLARGVAYGRYVAAGNLVEGYSPTIDGFVDGLRPVAGDAYAGLAYFGGHYYPAEGPLLTWLASPLWAVGNLIAMLAPGAGWGPALVGLLAPALLLTLLLGVAALVRQAALPPASAALVLLGAALMTPLVPASLGQSGWLLPAAALTWLLAGRAWPGGRGALGQGLLAGLVAGAQPWLAPAALAALAPGRPAWPGRAAGLLAALAPVALWQFILFERPWRPASQFLVAPPPAGALDLPVLFWAVALALGLAGHGLRPVPWRLVVALLTVAGVMLAAGPLAERLVVLVGPATWGACQVLARRRPRPALLGLGAAVGLVGGLALILNAVVDVQAASWVVGYRPEQRLMGAAVVLLGGLVLLSGARPRRAAAVTATSLAALCLLVAGGQRAAATEAPASLMPPFTAAPASGGAALVLWRLHGGADIAGGTLSLPGPEARAESPLVAARAGERYCASAGPASGKVVLVWEDDGHHVLAEHGRPGAAARLCFAAPPDTAGVRLRLVGGERPLTVEAAALWSDSARLAPLPDYATAALALTFDWESVMGGLIHSKGGAGGYESETEGHGRDEGADPRAVAVERGARMRQGAANLADLFRPHGIRGTFYATGYNLLTGNQERRTFAGDPIYRWAGTRNRWGSDYWTTNRWYGDDPYGTEATHPEWYYGSLTQRLAAEGHEIETHTFGHLYVRGTTPEELERDLVEWNRAAAELGLPPARSFAFPWRSSNSVRAPHYERMTRLGITSVTRVYSLRPGADFELDAVEGMPGLLIFPDRIIESNPGGAALGRRTIDEVLLRRGYASLWTHPEAVVDAAEVAAWREVIDYAAAARDRGLWVAPLVHVLEQVRAARRVEVVTLRDGGVTLVVLGNAGAGALTGLVTEVPRAGRFQHHGAAWPDSRGERVRLPALGPGTSVTLLAVPGQEGRR